MRMLQTLLLPIDFSPCAEEATQAAISLARSFKSKIVLMFVLPDDFDSPEDLAQARDGARARLDQVRRQCHAQSIECGDPVLVSGVPFERIVEQAILLDVNAIVVGAGDDDSTTGTTAEQIGRRSPKPVWIVRKGSTTPPKRLACAIDFSEHSARALRNAIHLARHFNSDLAIIHVVESRNWLLSPRPGQDDTQRLADFEGKLNAELEKFDTHGLHVDTMVRVGKVGDEILAAARETQADLLVIGSSGRSGIARAFMGSVAMKVLRKIPCAVITVKAEDPIRVEFRHEVEHLAQRLERGASLLAKRFSDEAIVEFRRYLEEDPVCVEAWEGMSAAYAQLGNDAESQQCLDKAEHIRKVIDHRKIEADIRRSHPLWRK